METESENIVLVRRLAHLARMDLNKEEEKRYAKDVKDIIEYVGKIGSVSASEKPLLSTISGVSHVLREDKAEDSLLADALLAAAPEKKGRLIKVPRIL